jgi:HD-like signal output (HDOD) protein
MIAGDTTLSARILRLANSAFYYRMAPVTRIRDALTRLGFKTTRSTVVTVWTQSLKAFKHNLREAATVSMLLNHGTACAVIAKAICEQVNRERAEEVFLAALLHDLGRIVLAFQLGDSYVADVLLVADRQNRTTCDVEEEMLGLNHAKLGGRLMQAWRLPALFEEAARGHHDEVRPGETAPELAAVMLADIWATELGHNLARHALRPSPDGLVELLALPDPERFKETCKDKIATMMDIFEA